MPHQINALQLGFILAGYLSAVPHGQSAPAAVIHEIHYHPVENAAFNPDGSPVLDLSEDVHEFVELHNPGPAALSLTGWKLSGGISFAFPGGSSIAPGGYLVVAKNPSRLMTVYSGLSGVVGPYAGTLGNGADTVRLRNAADETIDSVSYSSRFPWPTGADGLGASDDFTLLNSATYQYKGRSLQRVSVEGASNDPANWLASPTGSSPTPGAANAVARAVPKPVLTSVFSVQASDDAPVIRATQQVRINCAFTSTANLTGPVVEYFVDDVNSFSEPRNTVVMTDLGGGQYSAVLPGQADRSVVRYRIKVDRGDGLEIAGPRTDDALVVPVSLTVREGWFSYFITPVRAASPNPVYDLFVSTDGSVVSDTAGANIYPFTGLNGLQTMAYNATGSPKRVTSSAGTGLPRDLPYVATTDRIWNGAVPAIFVENGTVRDILFRLHGSRYNRRPSRSTYKLRFADTQKYLEADSMFVTDKSDYFSVMHGLYVNASLPLSSVRWVDWYLNANAKAVKLEQGEYNGDLLNLFHDRQAKLNPGQPKETNGEFFKNVGTIEDAGEGPYGRGDGRALAATGPWTSVQRYEWTYLLQNNGWKGAKPMKEFIDGLWSARGDTHTTPNPNIQSLRVYLDSVLDVETTLTSLAILNWACPWDDTTQNHYFWRRASGKWAHFPWDFDAFFGNGDTTGTNSWIYVGENGTPPAGILGNNFRGPNFFKDSIFKAYRTEYNERLWLLNNTYLHPDNLKTLYFTNGSGGSVSYYSYINSVKAGFCEARFSSVNTQLGHAADGSDFLRPAKPTHAAPVSASAILPPGLLAASAYTHSSGSTSGASAHATSKWEIRRSSGNYLEPVFVTTSSTSLTSLAIPFQELTFGETYFWRVTYTDAAGHTSLISTETSFVYGPPPTNVTVISFSDTWKYNYAIAPTDTAWTSAAFDDSSWSSGQGTLAFETQSQIPETIRTPLPDPRTLSPAGRAYYFRRHFAFPANPLNSTLRIRHVMDDGCVIYINGQRVHRYYMNDAASYAASTFSNGSPGDGVYQFADAVTNAGAAAWTWLDPRPYMVQGDNVIAIQVHQTSATSSDITMGLEMTAIVPAGGGDVVLNEIMADNSSLTVSGTKNADWIELKNTTAAPVDISGWGLSDDILIPNRYTFPPGTVIPAQSYLTVWCDDGESYRADLTPAPGPHTGFGLDRGGQRIVLTSAGQLKDFVAFGPQARDFTLSRLPDGTGPFTLGLPTRDATNAAITSLGSQADLRLNEWMANPAHGDDWFEIYNTSPNPVALAGLWLSDTPSLPKITQIPPLSFVAGRGFTIFSADGTNNGTNRCNFKLSSGGDRLLIHNTAGAAVLDSQAFGVQTKNTAQGRLPDGTGPIVNFTTTASAAASNWLPSPIVISEALSHGTESGADFIELHNPATSPVNIGNWWISNQKFTLQKYQIPTGATIPAGGFYTIPEAAYSTGAVPFSLDAYGDDVVLTAVDSFGVPTGYRDQVSFGPASANTSFGRVNALPSSEFWPQTALTANAVNGLPKTSPLILNEVHYHPLDLPTGDNDRDEFIEVHNPTTSPVNLAGWRLKNDVDFSFPSTSTLAPGAYLLVVGFDPVAPENATTLTDFRNTYGLGAAVPILGPFSSKMPNDEASIELSRPDQLAGVAVDLLVDKIQYADFLPWATSADGSGSSLQRLSRTVIGNDATNWTAAVPTPGSVNFGQVPITDNDGDGLPNSWEDAYGFDLYSSADAQADADGDGMSNLEEFTAGTHPRNTEDRFLATATPTSSATGTIIHFQAKAGRTYSILYSEELSVWEKLTDIAAQPVEGPVERTDPSINSRRRFYKVVTPQIP